MKQLTLTQKKFQEAAEIMPWAEALDYTEYLTGERKRWKCAEYHLPHLVERGVLKRVRYGRKYVYAISPSKTRHKGSIQHDLICTKALLGFKASNIEADFVSENYFRRCGFQAVPEWAVTLSGSESIVHFEYSTADNFRRRRLMNHKIAQYKNAHDRLEEHFGKRPLILFVFDAPEYAIRNFLKNKDELDAFYFTDYESFFSVPKGQQLLAPIYIWGGDREKYPLVQS